MQNKDFWISVLDRLKPTIQKANFITWFQNTTIVSHENEEVVIGVPNTFAYNWISNKYHLKVAQAVQELDPTIKTVKYEIVGKLSEPGNCEAVDVKRIVSREDDKHVRKVRNLNEVMVTKGNSTGGGVSSQMLNSRYNLNNFVVGRDNRLPHAACLAVSNSPGGIYNPLYIYGSVGLGKTHLLQSIGNEVLKNFPDMVVKCITAERFVTEVVDAIGKRYMKSFKQQYRDVDCFLLDDVQFFARKDSSQQEFFHTFNELYNANKQIVITSDRPPSELDGLDERLKSRFGMGMVVELLFPDFETRLAILNEKCKEFQVIVDPEVLSFIASNVHNNVRELESVLRQVLAECHLCDKVATIRSVAEIIKRMNKAQQIIGFDLEQKNAACAALTGKDIMEIVAQYYKVSIEDLVSDKRNQEVMLPRQVCMYLVKNELGQSYEKIGADFGGRNHTTVMHACSKTSTKLRKDIKLVRDINTIKRELGL